MKHLSTSDYIEMPWKNGRGMTTEIMKRERAQRIQYRLSSAIVETSGPFSLFPGLRRILVNLGPSSMTLRMNGSTTSQDSQRLDPGQIYQFEGDIPIDCEVERSSRDFNIFYDPLRMDVKVRCAAIGEQASVAIPRTGTVFLFVISGRIQARSIAQGKTCEAKAFESIFIENSSHDDEWKILVLLDPWWVISLKIKQKA